jgi:hypothetical protein
MSKFVKHFYTYFQHLWSDMGEIQQGLLFSIYKFRESWRRNTLLFVGLQRTCVKPHGTWTVKKALLRSLYHVAEFSICSLLDEVNLC